MVENAIFQVVWYFRGYDWLVWRNLISPRGSHEGKYMGCSFLQLLLDACAETLETLWFCPSDPHGERVPLEGVLGIYEQKFLS